MCLCVCLVSCVCPYAYCISMCTPVSYVSHIREYSLSVCVSSNFYRLSKLAFITDWVRELWVHWQLFGNTCTIDVAILYAKAVCPPFLPQIRMYMCSGTRLSTHVHEWWCGVVAVCLPLNVWAAYTVCIECHDVWAFCPEPAFCNSLQADSSTYT